MTELPANQIKYILETDGSPACEVAEKLLETHGIKFSRAYRVKDPYDIDTYPTLEIRGPSFWDILPNLPSIRAFLPPIPEEK